MTEGRKYHRYRDFFPFYLAEHADPVCRRLHYVGTSIEILSLVALVLTGNFWFLLSAVVGGYGFAWLGHFFFERNKPATFTYPFWSYLADHHMLWLAVTGRLGDRLGQARVRDTG
jgi:hypothetical protein